MFIQKLFMISIIALMIGCAHKKTYEIDVAVIQNKKPVIHSTLVATEEQMASIGEQTKNGNVLLEVTPSEKVINGHRGIFLAMSFATINKKGEKSIVATPEMFVQKGTEAIFDLDSFVAENNYTFKVLVK